MDDSASTAQAVAIRDGYILAVGANRDLRKLTGPRTETINAHGGSVLPGINDAHLHLAEYGQTFLSVDVDTDNLGDLIARVAAAADSTPAGQWIRGSGWSELRLPRAPTRHDLDPVTGDRPTILVDFTLHTTVANTAALRAAGVDASTQPAAGSVIERDPDGQPNGLLREGAQAYVQRVLPPYSSTQMADAIGRATAVLHSRGITSLTEPGIDPPMADLYQLLAAEGRLAMRVTALLRAGDSPETMRQALDQLRRRPRQPRGRFRLNGVKIFSDGVPTQARTAWMRQPYLDGTNGALTIAGANTSEQIDNLATMIRMAHLAGAQIGTHACGDAAIDAVIAAMSRIRPGRHRHYLIHGDFVSPQTLQSMAAHHIAVSMNAEIKYMIGNALEPLLGADRTRYHWPYRVAQRAGVNVTSGSDAPVTDPNWLSGLASMVARIDAAGQVSGPDQRINLNSALRTYTSAPAWQDGSDSWKGALRQAMAADLCILGADLRRSDPHDYSRIAVRATISGGRVVYEGGTAQPRSREQRRSRYLQHGCHGHQTS
ncbi:amidohydrolase [Catellatospora sp. NPDC049111]|uniref:amidohydrolase n=1 Tax=Catellatospora sp. NPDC049111 TaxID=3155271 RepID=UPI0033C4BE3C